MKRLFTILFLFGLSFNGIAQQLEIDSLRSLLETPECQKDDSSRLTVLIDLSYYLCFTNLDSVIEVSHEAIRVSRVLNDKSAEGKALSNEGYALSAKGKYHLAISRYLNAIVIFEKEDNFDDIINTNISIGAAYLSLKNRGKALEYNQIAYNIAKAEEKNFFLIIALINLGEVNIDNDLDLAIKNYIEALDNLDKITDYRKPLLEQALYRALGNAYYRKKEFNKSIRYYKTALEKVANEDIGSLPPIYNSLSDVYIEIENYTEAYNSLNLSIHFAEKIGDNKSLKEAYQKLATIGGRTGNYKDAYNNHIKYSDLKDSFFDKEKSRDINELEARYKTEKQKQELKIQDAELDAKVQELERDKFQKNILMGALSFGLIFIFFIIKGFLNKKKINKKLHYNNLLITDSIDYARRIQKGVFPSKEDVWKIFPKIMIFLQPKDIVSGDFYWVYQKENKKYLVVADCTGHGVPGAFMTIIGINILNEIMNAGIAISPAEIIKELNTKLRDYLNVNRWGGKDGMDIAVACIDEKAQTLQFCGTHLSAYVITEGETTRLKGDNAFVGMKDEIKVKNQTFNYEDGSRLYLFTDGFPDQKGGPKNKKYYYPPLIDLLVRTNVMDSNVQYDKIKEELISWRGNTEQFDDVLVVGLKL